MKLRLSLPVVLASLGAVLFTVGAVVPCPRLPVAERREVPQPVRVAEDGPDAVAEAGPVLAKAELRER